jgi:hypothetical protein
MPRLGAPPFEALKKELIDDINRNIKYEQDAQTYYNELITRVLSIRFDYPKLDMIQDILNMLREHLRDEKEHEDNLKRTLITVQFWNEPPKIEPAYEHQFGGKTHIQEGQLVKLRALTDEELQILHRRWESGMPKGEHGGLFLERPEEEQQLGNFLRAIHLLETETDAVKSLTIIAQRDHWSPASIDIARIGIRMATRPAEFWRQFKGEVI